MLCLRTVLLHLVVIAVIVVVVMLLRAVGCIASQPVCALRIPFSPANSIPPIPVQCPSRPLAPDLFYSSERFSLKKVKSFFGEADNALKSGVLHIHVGCHVTQQTARSETNIHPFR